MQRFLGKAVLATVFLCVGSAMAAPLTATLRLRERVTMEQLAQNVRNPRSEHFAKFYEPAEIRRLSAPTDGEYEELLSGLKAEGLKVMAESPTHLWVTVRGESAIFESLFATRIEAVGPGRHRAQSAPRMPFHLALVQSVSGLDNTRKSHSKMVRQAGVNSLANGGISNATIKTAYGFDQIYSSGLTGKGQHIAIATYNSFNVDNVKQYYALVGLSPVPAVDMISFNGAAPYDASAAGETELDSEFSGMLAPGASIHVFTSATNDDAGEVQMFTAILDDGRAKIVNYSWGSCETTVTPQHRLDMEKVFARAVAQGVNILVASGDSGSDSCATGSAAADWPAASFYVIAVGGTSFDYGDSGLAETAWSGSGGGISGIWDLPLWQQTLGAPYLKRSYPDVAFNADPATGQAIFTGPAGAGGWEVIGGTSMAAPQWAGFLALVGEARQAQGKADIGFINPVVYAMSDSDRANTLNDIVSGSNGDYTAVIGWDAVTGFGSLKANAFLNYLLSQ